jgi:hypothetical protein
MSEDRDELLDLMNQPPSCRSPTAPSYLPF